jgi:urease accessory protein
MVVSASPLTDTLRLLQFGDSMFPVGAFAFSGGLEMAVQTGVVRDRDDLAEYTRTVIHLAAAGDGIALLAAHRGAVAGDLDRIRRADEAIYLRKVSQEARTMTVRMGRKLAELATHIIGDSLLGSRLRDADTDSVPITYPAALGVLFAELGLSEEEAFAVHQYGVATMVLGAAVRLMRVDHRDTQAILFAVNTNAGDEYGRAVSATLDDMAAFGPMVDVLASAHAHAHVRMFMN